MFNRIFSTVFPKTPAKPVFIQPIAPVDEYAQYDNIPDEFKSLLKKMDQANIVKAR